MRKCAGIAIGVLALAGAIPVQAQFGSFSDPFSPGGGKGNPTLGAVPPTASATPTESIKEPSAIQVDSVILPGAPDGYVDGYVWVTPHEVNTGGVYQRLVKYTGSVAGGKASGFGRLIVGAPLPPTGPGIIAGYGNPFGEDGFVHTGEFVNGKPKGPGLLYSRNTSQTLKGEFWDFMDIRGPTTVGVGDRQVVYANSDEHGFADGPFKRYLYNASGSGPTHVYLGEIKDGKISGSWSPLPWTEKTLAGAVSGYAEWIYFKRDNESLHRCKSLSAMALPAPMPALANDIPGALQTTTDPTTFPPLMLCETQAISGWRFTYEATRNKVIGGEIKPLSCADAAGRPGALSLNADEFVCLVQTVTVTRKKLNPFEKIWRETKRVKNQAFDVFDDAGDSFSDLMCDIVQKKKGKNCNVNVKVGTTFDVPTGTTKVSVSPIAAPVDAIAAQKAKAFYEKISTHAADSEAGKWAKNAGEIYSLCVQTCGSPASERYSLLQLEQLAKVTESAAPEAMKGRQIASITSDMREIGVWLLDTTPVISLVYRTYKVSRIADVVIDGKSQIFSLPPHVKTEQYLARAKAEKQLTNLGIALTNELAVPLAIDGMTAYYQAAFPSIPGLSSAVQYSVLKRTGIDVDEFLKVHKELKDAEQFTQAAVMDILLELDKAETKYGPKLLY